MCHMLVVLIIPIVAVVLQNSILLRQQITKYETTKRVGEEVWDDYKLELNPFIYPPSFESCSLDPHDHQHNQPGAGRAD